MVNIFAINPGSTSTKVGLFCDSDSIKEETIRYDKNELVKFSKIIEQIGYRLGSIEHFIKRNNIDLNDIDYLLEEEVY